MDSRSDWDDFKERVREMTDIVDLVGQYVQLKPSGKTMKACCPFHAEKTPSFHVDRARQFWRCYGACSDGGDVFKFYMKQEGVDFKEALEHLASRAGLEVPRGRGDPEKAKAEREGRDRFWALQHNACRFFQRSYADASGVDARNYAHGRGLTDASVERFEVGYAPSSFDALSLYFSKEGTPEAHVLEAGLVSERERGGVYDRFRNRLMFPIRDDQARLVGFGGRLLGDDEKGAKYLNSPGTDFFHKGKLLYGFDLAKNSIRTKGSAVVCEGYLDVIGAHQAGLENVVATLGTALTEDHLRLLKRFADRLLLSFDGDEPGRKAAEKAGALCLKIGMPARIVLLPDDMDVADMCFGGRVAEFKERLAEGVAIFPFLVSRICERFDMENASTKAQAAHEVMDLVFEVEDEIARVEYRQQAAALLNIPERSLQSVMRQQRPQRLGPGPRENEAAPPAHREPSRQDRAERDLVEFFLSSRDFFQGFLDLNLSGKSAKLWLSDPGTKEIVDVLERIWPEAPADIAGRVLEQLQNGEASVWVYDLSRREKKNWRANESDRGHKALSAWQRMILQQKIDLVQNQIRQAGAGTVNTLLQEFGDLKNTLKSIQ